MKFSTYLLILIFSSLTVSTLSAQDSKPWTMMVYLNGSDLESGSDAGTIDFQEMLAVSATENVNIIVLTGGANKPGWTTIEAFLIENGTETDLNYTANVDEDMGNPQNLTNFINWTVTNYPATKYMLDMWNHGGDIQGYGWDEISGNHLSVPSLRSAIAATDYIQNGNKFELIGFDACLMATLEVASTLSQYGEYMVASEEQEPGHGWNYTPIVEALQTGAELDGAQIGFATIDGFIAQGQTEGTHGLTLSVIDLTLIDDLTNSIESLLTKVQNEDKVELLQRARGKSQEFSKNTKSPSDSEDMVDIGDMAKELKKIDASFSTEVDAVLTDLNSVILYERHDDTRPKSTGLTMFLPHNKLVDASGTNSYVTANYMPIDFSSEIKNFVSTTYVPIALQDQTPPTGSTQEGFGGNNSSFGAGSIMDTLFSAIEIPDADDLDQIQIVLIEEFEGFPNEYILLGSTFPDTFAVTSGNAELYGYRWDGLWLGINGYPAYISDIHDYELETSPGVFEIETQIHIPAILNPDENFDGIDISLEYIYDEEFNTRLVGINREPYLLAGQLVVPKEKIKLVPGDRVMLLYESFNDVTDEEFFVIDEDAVFTIEVDNNDLELEYDELEPGNYQLGFLLTDHSQNDTLIFEDAIYTIEPNSVTETFAAGGIKMFPNPANQVTMIDNQNFTGGSYDIRIADLNGRVIYAGTSTQQQFTVPTSTLPSGFYVVELASESKVFTDKLIIQHN